MNRITHKEACMKYNPLKKSMDYKGMREDENRNLVLVDGTVIPAEKRTRCEVYSRIVGYLRPLSQYNKGKQEEFKSRKTFNIKNEKAPSNK
jgi:ribonucleoside-triphosphate reductase